MKRVLVVGGALILFGAFLLFIYRDKNTLDDSFNVTLPTTQARPSIEETVKEKLYQIVEDNTITISISPALVFPDGLSEGNLNIVNSEDNLHAQVIEVVLDDTLETVYTSPLIPVGEILKKGKLDVPLPAGTYSCTAYFQAIDEDGETVIGKAGAKIIIIIEE